VFGRGVGTAGRRTRAAAVLASSAAHERRWSRTSSKPCAARTTSLRGTHHRGCGLHRLRSGALDHAVTQRIKATLRSGGPDLVHGNITRDTVREIETGLVEKTGGKMLPHVRRCLCELLHTFESVLIRPRWPHPTLSNGRADQRFVEVASSGRLRIPTKSPGHSDERCRRLQGPAGLNRCRPGARTGGGGQGSL
jgi:hypothetical protein